jgi:ferredoxin-NADP reductase/MOSC domain-containing protein YiiM
MQTGVLLMARLLAVNVGLPQNIDWNGRTVHTGVWKTPVVGPRMVGRLNVEGDGQGDLVGHGGEQRAVLVYQIDSYRYWEQRLGRSDFVYGQFGENFTVDGLRDDEVCIGDRYRIGQALFEVSQPRVTCYRVGIRMREPQMAALLVAHHRPGFYLRVLQEGEVAAGDEIIKVADGPEQLSVTEIDSLLYLPGHQRAQMERALRIPSLSPGWQTSFRAMLDQQHAGKLTGNAGLAPDVGPAPAWQGFRPMRVALVQPESRDVFSLELEQADGGEPIAPAAAGQFITLRLPTEGGHPPLLRSYSLSGSPESPRYRISIKQEPDGAAGRYLRERIHAGDTIAVAGPRGAFLLRSDVRPVVLLSAGIGATPVLAMLHALAAGATTRSVWWLHGARNGDEHPFAQEVRGLLEALHDGHRYIVYSRPLVNDRQGIDFDHEGHLTIDVLQQFGVPRDADFYLCGPSGFMRDLRAGLEAWGVAPDRIRTEIFGPGLAIAPGVVDRTMPYPHSPSGPAGTGPQVSFSRSGLTVNWSSEYSSLLELAEACDVVVRWSCRTGVCHTCVSGLLAGAVSYQPEPVEYPGEDTVLICCSTPKTNVALDL